MTYSVASRSAVADAHERIVDAVESRSEEAADQEMRQHLIEAGKYWKARFGRAVRTRRQLEPVTVGDERIRSSGRT